MKGAKFYRPVSFALVLSLAPVSQAHAFEWADLWSSPEQRALKQLENEQYEELIDSAPDANWRGLGEYRSGNYSAAAESFAQQKELAEEAGQPVLSERAKYNQANAHVRDEQYEQAMALYDDILDANPDHDNAKHNRSITQQLIEQQQQQQQQEQQGDGQESDQQQESESGEGKESDQQESESGENQDPSDRESSDQNDQQEQNSDQQSASSNSQGDEQDQSEAAQSAAEQAEEEAAAAQAMAAEQEREAQQQPTEDEPTEQALQESTEPLTEREQANEQWLRKIPDDPVGLLQRKLQNRHLTDFPQVKDSDKPW